LSDATRRAARPPQRGPQLRLWRSLFVMWFVAVKIMPVNTERKDHVGLPN
jgi:hypothetical protein